MRETFIDAGGPGSPGRTFQDHRRDGLGLKELEAGLVAAGMVLDYIRDTRKAVLPNITSLKVYNPGRYMTLGASTKKNLELFDSISSDRACTLFSIMNRTETSMGARRLSDWLSFPLMDPSEINNRLDAVEELTRDPVLSGNIREILADIRTWRG